MSTMSLFRQYRPTRFADVYGQDHVTRTLQNALRTGRIAQAYLFCGPRGVGKTTIARILARALNCEHGVSPEPCGECESCRRIAAGSSLSVIEIDAASNRTIEDIRSLREDVQFAPTDGRTKVYILDEAHQITGPAFEAFLKTLEEPPPYVVFVLATTEPQKLPATILSRCQRFDFRRVSVEDIVARLREVAAAEGLSVDEEAFHAVARAADGGLRDALSVLDQIVAYAGQRVTAEDVAAVLGSLDAEVRFALGDLLAQRDVPGALAWLSGLLDAGRDARLVVSEALAHCRLLLLARLRCAPEQLKALPPAVRERLEAQAAQFEPAELMATIEAFATCDKALRWHPQPRILLEVTLIDILVGAPAPPVMVAAPSYERPAAPQRPASGPPAAAAPPVRRPALPPGRVEDQVLPADEPLSLEAVRARLPLFMGLLREGWPALMALLLHGDVIRVEGNVVVFGFEGWEASRSLCMQEDRRKIIEETLSKVLGRPVLFRGELVDAASAAEPAVGEPVVDLDEAVAAAQEAFPDSRVIDG